MKCSLGWLTLMAVVLQQAVCMVSQRSHYTAGVVEFRPIDLTSNLAAYLELINSSEAAATDLIVFPEGTLNDNDAATIVPDPLAGWLAPCLTDPQAVEYHKLLVDLSCAARRARKYVVVNLSEKAKCLPPASDPRPCSVDGFNMFNTNVVFDREGRVVSRYRKINLFGEPKNVTWLPEVGWFDTDFGVRFGHFICFDILFYTPGQRLLEEHGVRDFIFSSMWFSQLPFLTAVQFQFSWSYGNNVTLLAAGASRPELGNSGSGIYTGRQDPTLMVMHRWGGERRLYVAEVPIRQRAAAAVWTTKTQSISYQSLVNDDATNKATNSTTIRLKRDYLELYVSVPLNMSRGQSHSQELCYHNNTLCCQFELNWRSLDGVPADSTYYSYRLGVFDGWRHEDGPAENLLKNCALFPCLGDGQDIMQCGRWLEEDAGNGVVTPQYAFESVLIEAIFPRKQQYLLMPNTLTDDLLPLPLSAFEWEESISGLNHTVRMRLNRTTANLLTFSIYSNYFDGSPDAIVSPGSNSTENRDDGAVWQTVCQTALFVCVALVLVL